MVDDGSAGGRTFATHPPKLFNRLVADLLRSPIHGVLDPGICELRFDGRRSGRSIRVPVMYVALGDAWFVVAGDAPDKLWWRNFIEPHPVRVLHDGRVRAATGRVVPPTDPLWAKAWAAYTAKHHVPRETRDQLIMVSGWMTTSPPFTTSETT